jgi:hypothetical protein
MTAIYALVIMATLQGAAPNTVHLYQDADGCHAAKRNVSEFMAKTAPGWKVVRFFCAEVISTVK